MDKKLKVQDIYNTIFSKQNWITKLPQPQFAISDIIEANARKLDKSMLRYDIPVLLDIDVLTDFKQYGGFIYPAEKTGLAMLITAAPDKLFSVTFAVTENQELALLVSLHTTSPSTYFDFMEEYMDREVVPKTASLGFH